MCLSSATNFSVKIILLRSNSKPVRVVHTKHVHTLSFYLCLIRTSHSLLAATHRSLSPCLTLTVIQPWHLLPEPPLTCLPTSSHPLQLHFLLLTLRLRPSPCFNLCLHAVSVSRLMPCGVLDRAARSKVLI